MSLSSFRSVIHSLTHSLIWLVLSILSFSSQNPSCTYSSVCSSRLVLTCCHLLFICPCWTLYIHWSLDIYMYMYTYIHIYIIFPMQIIKNCRQEIICYNTLYYTARPGLSGAGPTPPRAQAKRRQLPRHRAPAREPWATWRRASMRKEPSWALVKEGRLSYHE